MASSSNIGARDATQEVSGSGEFRRTESKCREWVRAAEDSKYPAEANRYHLYISYACPWACRCLSAVALKGLEDCISVSVTSPIWDYTKPGQDEHRGWMFADSSDIPGAIPDPIFNAKTIREIYEKCDPSVEKFTVPVLLDTKTNTIVNNESSEILRMFNSEFNKFAKVPELDLFPKELQPKIEELNSWIYPWINNGVYRAGFARNQEPYVKAVTEVFKGLDRCEEILSQSRYLCGDKLTEADIRLFVTLARFDEVYVVHFKCNKKAIREYPNVYAYMRDIYQHKLPDGTTLGEKTVNIWHIKNHYYRSHPSINPFAIVPTETVTDFMLPHSRDKM